MSILTSKQIAARLNIHERGIVVLMERLDALRDHVKALEALEANAPAPPDVEAAPRKRKRR